jgi:hypothetical protein
VHQELVGSSYLRTHAGFALRCVLCLCFGTTEGCVLRDLWSAVVLRAVLYNARHFEQQRSAALAPYATLW